MSPSISVKAIVADGPLEKPALAGGEIVERDDLVAPREQPIDEIAANEPGATCDKTTHTDRIIS